MFYFDIYKIPINSYWQWIIVMKFHSVYSNIGAKILGTNFVMVRQLTCWIMSLFTNICKTRALRLQKLVWFACRRVHEEVVPGYYNPFDLIKWQNEKPVYEETVLTACSLKHVDFGDSGTVLHAQRYFHDRRDNVVDIDEYNHIQREHLTCINFDLMSLYVHGFQNLMESGVFRLVADNLPIPPEVYNTDLVKSVKTLYTFLQNIGKL